MKLWLWKHNNPVVFKANTMWNKGDDFMSRQKKIMSERLKEEIAKELGVYDKVSSDGWGSVSSRNCGNMVRKAIEKAQREYVGK
jgi:small acid-soluble spore protein F (minor alpha/beta-type SASP)